MVMIVEKILFSEEDFEFQNMRIALWEMYMEKIINYQMKNTDMF